MNQKRNILSRTKHFLRQFIHEEDGAETIEYIALLVIAFGLVALITRLKGTLDSKVTQAESYIDGIQMPGASSGAPSGNGG